MSQQVPIFRNNRFHHFLKLSIANVNAGLRARTDGGFDEIFLQQVAITGAGLWDGLIGVGNVLPFSKLKNYGDLLHYEMPMAGDKTALARSGWRRCDERKQLATGERKVSTRGIFSQPGMQWANYAKTILSA